MVKTHTRALALILGVAIAGTAVHAAPPGHPGDGLGPPSRQGADSHFAIHNGLRRHHEPAYAEGHIIVRFAPTVSTAMKHQITWSLGGSDYRPARFGDFGRVTVPRGTDAAELARRFRRSSSVASAELDPIVWPHVQGVTAAPRALSTRATRPGTAGPRRPAQAGAVTTPGGRGARSRVTAPTTPAGGATSFSTEVSPGMFTPAQNDPFLGLQWHHARIRLQESEQLNTTRGAGVTVAIIDSGVLFGSGGGCETAFPRGRGLDLGGVSFVPGFDFVNPGTAPLDQGNAENQNFFLLGHGTAIAAQLAAALNNDAGGRGIVPRVSIMPLRVFPRFGGTPFSVIAEAIDFAVQNGADVINMSLGGSEGSSVERQAIERAHAAGVVLVASSGNEADTADAPSDVSFPARYPQVIAVGATDFFDVRASYSNFGPNLDLAAPGGDFGRNPDPVGQAGGNQIFDGVLSPTFTQHPTTGAVNCAHFWLNGTSFSAPQVSAAAALLKAVGVDDPDIIQTLLQNGARDLGPVGFDNDTGHGLLDLLESHRGFGFSFE